MIPGRGTKISQASRPKNQNIKKQKQYYNEFNKNFKNGPHKKSLIKKKTPFCPSWSPPTASESKPTQSIESGSFSVRDRQLCQPCCSAAKNQTSLISLLSTIFPKRYIPLSSSSLSLLDKLIIAKTKARKRDCFQITKLSVLLSKTHTFLVSLWQ